MLTVLIIDDHPLVTDGIRTMLREAPHLEICGACKTAAQALEFLSGRMPDVILLDISLPDMDGLQLCAEIRKKNQVVKIIGLTSTNEAGIITGLLQRGGNGYLLKNMERDELIHAIDIVAGGKVYLSRAANEKVLEQFQSVRAAVENLPVLTRREKEILQLLDQGLTGPQIAEKLFLSPFTIETHRKNLLQKFSVTNTRLLINKAKENRLID